MYVLAVKSFNVILNFLPYDVMTLHITASDLAGFDFGVLAFLSEQLPGTEILKAEFLSKGGVGASHFLVVQDFVSSHLGFWWSVLIW
jgi:hypothetical protein